MAMPVQEMSKLLSVNVHKQLRPLNRPVETFSFRTRVRRKRMQGAPALVIRSSRIFWVILVRLSAPCFSDTMVRQFCFEHGSIGGRVSVSSVFEHGLSGRLLVIPLSISFKSNQPIKFNFLSSVRMGSTFECFLPAPRKSINSGVFSKDFSKLAVQSPSFGKAQGARPWCFPSGGG